MTMICNNCKYETNDITKLRIWTCIKENWKEYRCPKCYELILKKKLKE